MGALKRKQKNKRTVVIAISVMSAVVITVIIWIYFAFFNIKVIENVTLEAGKTVEASMFFEDKMPSDAVFAPALESIATDIPDETRISITVDKKQFSTMLTVVDTVAPTAKTKDSIKAWSTKLPSPADCIDTVNDATQVTFEWLTAPNVYVESDCEQKGIILLSDLGGNKTELEVSVWVTVDTQAPVIDWLSSIEAYAGDTIDYTANVTVTDDKYETPSLEIDDSCVDTTVAGSYTVTYRSTDGAGNIATETRTVILKEDTEAPVIEGISDLETCVGLPVDYKSTIVVTDNCATEPELDINDSELNFDVEGEYTVIYTASDATGNTTKVKSKIKVVKDSLAPVIGGVADYKIPIGYNFDIEKCISVTDDWDKEVKKVIEGSVDSSAEGKYPINVTATDFSGNTSSASFFVTYAVDNTAPVITASNINVYIGDTVSYRKTVNVTDDFYPAPKLTIDSSEVNLNQKGTYTVKYTATDFSGNTSSATATVNVTERPPMSEIVAQMADKVLAQIVNDNMTTLEKIYAVYKWTNRNVRYVGTSDKSNYIAGAYEGFSTGRGDCYTYYAVARVFLERLGVQNVEMMRINSRSLHFWNLVNLGSGWYHYDCSYFNGGNGHLFMLTDEELYAWDDLYYTGEHLFDTSLPYPERATESMQYVVDYSAKKIVQP